MLLQWSFSLHLPVLCGKALSASPLPPSPTPALHSTISSYVPSPSARVGIQCSGEFFGQVVLPEGGPGPRGEGGRRECVRRRVSEAFPLLVFLRGAPGPAVPSRGASRQRPLPRAPLRPEGQRVAVGSAEWMRPAPPWHTRGLSAPRAGPGLWLWEGLLEKEAELRTSGLHGREGLPGGTGWVPCDFSFPLNLIQVGSPSWWITAAQMLRFSFTFL